MSDAVGVAPLPAIELADGRATYRWDARRRPFLHPVRTPAGEVVTRDAPDDHPWHHGLWFTIKYVDGENYWEEMAPYGVLRHRGAPEVTATGDGGVVRGTVEWIHPDRETVVIEEDRTWGWATLGGDAYAIDLDTTLRPTATVLLDRTPFTTWGGYGGLTLRGAGDWVDTRLSIADADAAVERVLGEPARWCDISGRFPSGATGGVAILDHPENPRHPVPWYGSTRNELYGDDGWSNFLCAAFLFHAPLEVAGGDELRLRHRVVVHDGRWDAARVEPLWAAWSA